MTLQARVTRRLIVKATKTSFALELAQGYLKNSKTSFRCVHLRISIRSIQALHNKPSITPRSPTASSQVHLRDPKSCIQKLAAPNILKPNSVKTKAAGHHSKPEARNLLKAHGFETPQPG